jgi:hypothetical protein
MGKYTPVETNYIITLFSKKPSKRAKLEESTVEKENAVDQDATDACTASNSELVAVQSVNTNRIMNEVDELPLDACIVDESKEECYSQDEVENEVSLK